MNLTLRRIIFYTFCFLFLVISTLIILYASGYQINYRYLFTPLGVQKTGMTIIYSNPAGADIYLNNKMVKRFFQSVAWANYSSARYCHPDSGQH